jgi:hypothetical protein
MCYAQNDSGFGEAKSVQMDIYESGGTIVSSIQVYGYKEGGFCTCCLPLSLVLLCPPVLDHLSLSASAL